jgi:hypothetical protein
MMGVQVAPALLFYDFCLDDHVPLDHLLRRIDYFLDLESVRSELKPFYSSIGRPSVDPELMMRMLIVGYCMGIRSERRLCEEVHLNLAYRWFCRLGLDGDVPDCRLTRRHDADTQRNLLMSLRMTVKILVPIYSSAFALVAPFAFGPTERVWILHACKAMVPQLVKNIFQTSHHKRAMMGILWNLVAGDEYGRCYSGPQWWRKRGPALAYRPCGRSLVRRRTAVQIRLGSIGCDGRDGAPAFGLGDWRTRSGTVELWRPCRLHNYQYWPERHHWQYRP